MRRSALILIITASVLGVTFPAAGDELDSLRGQYTFDWHSDPAKAKCVAVDDKLLARFKSEAFTCDTNAVTNTASDEAARICTEKKDDGAEYLIFATEKSCETERETQASNGE